MPSFCHTQNTQKIMLMVLSLSLASSYNLHKKSPLAREYSGMWWAFHSVRDPSVLTNTHQVNVCAGWSHYSLWCSWEAKWRNLLRQPTIPAAAPWSVFGVVSWVLTQTFSTCGRGTRGRLYLVHLWWVEVLFAPRIFRFLFACFLSWGLTL